MVAKHSNCPKYILPFVTVISAWGCLSTSNLTTAKTLKKGSFSFAIGQTRSRQAGNFMHTSDANPHDENKEYEETYTQFPPVYGGRLGLSKNIEVGAAWWAGSTIVNGSLDAKFAIWESHSNYFSLGAGYRQGEVSYQKKRTSHSI